MAMSQVVAKAMGEELGTDMPVISLPGAAGTKAQKTAMGKPADGYTIFDGYVAPLVLQPILGNADWNFISREGYWIFLDRPVSATLVVINLLLLAAMIYLTIKRIRDAKENRLDK